MLRISDSVDQNQNDILSFDKKCVFILILSSCAREDVLIVKNENKVSGIKLKYDKPCKFDLLKHSGHQTSCSCYERRFVLVLLSTVIYRKIFRYMYLFQSFERFFYSTFSHVNRGQLGRVVCIFL